MDSMTHRVTRIMLRPPIDRLFALVIIMGKYIVAGPGLSKLNFDVDRVFWRDKKRPAEAGLGFYRI